MGTSSTGAATRTPDAAATRDLVGALRRAGVAEVDDSPLRRSLYSSDASLYRIPPQAVVLPRHVDEVLAVLAVATEHQVPVTMRGAGTSIAGNAVGPGIVVDTSRHLNRVLEIDPETRTALVEPGVVQSRLQRAAAPYGLRFGPDPSTHNRATLGGMIGNNACGSRALGYGRTSDNVLGLDVLAGTGERLRLGAIDGATEDSPLLADLRQLVRGNLATIRTELGRFGRQVSGYSLEHLLPERGFDVARALVGSEGTLALTLAARVRLVRDAPVRVLVALGYPSMAEAADAVPAVLPYAPIACEGLDRRIVDVVRARRGDAAVPDLPRGDGWLLVELAGDERSAVLDMAQRLAAGVGALDALVVTDPAHAAALWRIREDGAGLSARTPAGAPAHAGWEDAAVPPEQLGAYLREFEALLAEHRLTGLPYGHFGDGCVHIRIDFPLHAPDGTKVFKDFLYAAGELAARHGGSMSGEHGDGRARGELLPLMYSPDAIALFERVKAVFDPQDLLNPGVIVRPAPLDADVRVAAAPPLRRAELPSLALGYRHDRGDLSMAVHRCTGVGKCRADNTGSGGVMCPSFLATRDEKDSTRGRARVLQDVVSGRLGPDGWRSAALHDALDLCLSCKGCSADCPTGVDMAAYKAEALHQRYRKRIRPRSHYVLGWLPRWARLVGRVPAVTRVVNAMLRSTVLHPLITWSAGVDARRTLPSFATTTFRRWFARRDRPSQPGRHGDVVLFVDTFTDAFSPEVGRAAVAVLEQAGYRVSVTEKPVCCGLTWISTGQLDGARRQVQATVAALAPHVRAGATVVGLEPSCTAVLRSDALELLDGPDADAAAQVAAATRTLAELLTGTPDWSPPDLAGATAVAQPHCHHHAVMGWDADAALLKRAGVEVQRLGGCCGLAGNFGVERGHHDVSVAVAEHDLLPAVRGAAADAVVLADGFSCRTQLDTLADRSGEHLAQLLARHLPPEPPSR
ncbi:FAD/FMN-containing dehydrogenase [Micromonospora viridifaciens]|uniref:FAD/FMN-containing dehydrogenase n=1 Tax=Micromonospora viridifaciens TaxID=1881 RepID=A0A1C4XGR5_MICVI|nr:FAD-binding and (Fe-S)-binding domain-containing protein [Micromonospora viridifaciens]SCF07625.1 FAD/FMN-containing dehydrogenase [Micromonospora viridifaciens]